MLTSVQFLLVKVDKKLNPGGVCGGIQASPRGGEKVSVSGGARHPRDDDGAKPTLANVTATRLSGAC